MWGNARPWLYRNWVGCPVFRRVEREPKSGKIMTLEEVNKLVKNCAEQMNARYQEVVFDEWAVVSVAHKKSRILNYMGPRNDEFLKNFANDLGVLRTELLKDELGTGDFEFARYGVGTLFEAFMKLGDGVYLICNN